MNIGSSDTPTDWLRTTLKSQFRNSLLAAIDKHVMIKNIQFMRRSVEFDSRILILQEKTDTYSIASADMMRASFHVMAWIQTSICA